MLETKDLPLLEDITKDLGSGVQLIELLNIISGQEDCIGKYYKNPKLLLQKAENLNIALKYVQNRGIQLHNIGAEDILDGNLKLILGLLWMLISTFTLPKIVVQEGQGAKKVLLSWVQKKIGSYEGVNVVDFSSSWTDGKAFKALLHAHRPDLVQKYSLDNMSTNELISQIFKIAAKEMDIPQLLDVEDVCDVEKPDEKSVMAYIACWLHAFEEENNKPDVQEPKEKTESANLALEAISHYEARMSSLQKEIARFRDIWNEASFDTIYSHLRQMQLNFIAYKNQFKYKWIVEKAELLVLLDDIQSTMSTHGLDVYEPPEGLRLGDLERDWRGMISKELEHARLIEDSLAQVRETLCTSFSDCANLLALNLCEISSRVRTLDGTATEKLLTVSALLEESEALVPLVQSLEDWNVQCVEAGIMQNVYTAFTFEELQLEHNLVRSSLAKIQGMAETEVAKRVLNTLATVTPEQIGQAWEKAGKLGKDGVTEPEFGEALAGLGVKGSGIELRVLFHRALESASSDTSLEVKQVHNSPKIDQSSPCPSIEGDDSNTVQDRTTANESSTTLNTSSWKSSSNPSFQSSSSASSLAEPTLSSLAFASFMSKTAHTTDSQASLSFQEIAKGKRYITKSDLERLHVESGVVDKFVSKTTQPEKEEKKIASRLAGLGISMTVKETS